MIYLDNCATTKLSDNVKQNILNNLNTFGNPSSSYNIGCISHNIIEESREKVAKAITCEPSQIYFTSGSSESNTWALNQSDKCICSPIEHHSILNNPRTIQMPFNECLEIDNPIPCVISYMLVNNEIGTITDIKMLSDKFSEYDNILIHTDATQAIGNIKVDVQELNVDMMSFSGHKFHAPKGVGVLYSRVPLKPLIYGGKQEKGIRGGTENIIGISALGVAIEDAIDNLDIKRDICSKIKSNIVKRLNESNVDYVENGKNTISSTLNISIKNMDGEALMNYLDIKNICISTSSACNSGSLEPSETIKSLNLPKEYINGIIRMSFDTNNTVEESNIVCDEIIKYYKMMKGE